MRNFQSNLISLFFMCGVGIGLTAVITLTLTRATVSQAAPAATTWYVDSGSGSDGNDCLSTGAACETIKTAVSKATDDDTIQLAAGVYLETDIEIYKRLTLIGAGAETTIIDGNFADRVFQIGAKTTISDVTIQHGKNVTTSSIIFDTGGGAILNGGELTIQNSVLLENSTVGTGGAIFNYGELTIDNTEILTNTTDSIGGGIYNYSFGAITVTNSLIAGNEAKGSQGGGIYTPNPMILQNVTIRDNSAGSFGGGIIAGGNTLLDGVTLTGNESAAGAALFAQQGTITLTNVTVSDNTASNNYGGVYVSGPSTSLYVQNSTIANNHRTNANANGFNGLFIGNNASLEVVNTLLAGNDENNCGGTSGNWTSLGNNLSSDFSCAFVQTGDQQGADPLLGPLANNGGATFTHGLLPLSPAIDAGSNANCPATDQRGIARPYDGDGDSTATCDVGAVEAQHQITIADVSILEGSVGVKTAVFTVTLSPSHAQVVTVDYTTANDSAAAGSDFTAVADTLTFNVGETTKTINVPITTDTDDEADETFFVQLSSATNATLLDDEAVGTIIDDDGLPSLTISDQTILEGNSGTQNAVFVVTLSPASVDVVTVDASTVTGAAANGVDFTAVFDTLTFTPGQTSKEISVPILGDVIDEGVAETFTIMLSNPSNATIIDDSAIGTITDDDTARLRHGTRVEVYEGDSGTTPAVFTVTLSTPAAYVITVDFEVKSGVASSDGAIAGEDFTANSGTLTFQPGETTQNYTVDIIGDTKLEPDELYSTLISNANVPISVNGNLATILNDDGPSIYLPLVVK